ncbi:oligopeptide/dipeptide ABC transporter ATP-binding protein [Halogranum amylolyticum]|uniref:oligopeptide/dipeptide ABC transporter ATP-binding protein n=1 Tax=Halogranum amylolyticum TaxID=660520 RepID=UPI00373FD8D7
MDDGNKAAVELLINTGYRWEHPYSKALLAATPESDPFNDREHAEIQGSIPDPINLPSGCRFKDRCPRGRTSGATSAPSFSKRTAKHGLLVIPITARRTGNGWKQHSNRLQTLTSIHGRTSRSCPATKELPISPKS